MQNAERETAEHSTPPVYQGSVRLHDWRNTARSGMTVDFGIRDVAPTTPHPFKGLVCGREHGQRFRVWIGPPSEEETCGDGVISPHYVGEAILLRWSDDSVSGMSVRFGIDGGPDGAAGRHPFEGLATGRKEGESLYVAAWAITDDERVVHPSKTRRKTPFHELSATRQTNILCRDQRFVSWLGKVAQEHARNAGAPPAERDPVGFAAVTLRAMLGINSRAVLNHETFEGSQARRRWENIMRSYFGSLQSGRS